MMWKTPCKYLILILLIMLFGCKTEPEITYQVTEGTVTGGTISSGLGEYAPGETVFISASADDPQGTPVFSTNIEVSGEITAETGTQGEWSYSFTMPGDDVLVSVVFQVFYAVSEGTVTGGTITNGLGSYSPGDTVAIVAEAEDAEDVPSFTTDTSVSGETVSETGNPGEWSYNFIMPGKDVSVTVVFETAAYAVTEGTVTGGSILSGLGEYTEGEAVVITASGDEANWIPGFTADPEVTDAVIEESETSGEWSYRFTMPASGVCVSVEFAQPVLDSLSFSRVPEHVYRGDTFVLEVKAFDQVGRDYTPEDSVEVSLDHSGTEADLSGTSTKSFSGDSAVILFDDLSFDIPESAILLTASGPDGTSISSEIDVLGPLLETGFETTLLEEGWKRENLKGTGDKWARRTNIMRTGSASAGMENQFTGSQEDDWLITPGITVTENSELRFYRLSAWYDLYKYNGVWVSTDDQDPANFSELEELGEAPDDGWHFYSIDLSDYAGQTIYAAFVYTYTNSVGDSFYIDDVEITQ